MTGIEDVPPGLIDSIERPIVFAGDPPIKTLVVGSAFRNAGTPTSGRMRDGLSQAERAVKRVGSLQRFLGPHFAVRMVAAEGDSTDDTQDQLQRAAVRYNVALTIVDVSHGGPLFGSTEAPERMRLLSGVGNGILRSVTAADDFLFYVESDLIWLPYHVGVMLADVRPGFDVIVPMVMAGEHFYDVWGFRGLDGQRWSPFPPYHSQRNAEDLTELSSAGSCLVMRAEVARVAPLMTDGALVEWCAGARAAGFRIFAHPHVDVRHPT